MPKLNYKKRIVLLMITVSIMLGNPFEAHAWHDFTQFKTNDFHGIVATANVVLHKYEKTPSGVIVARSIKDAEFILLKQNNEGEWEQMGGIYTTDFSGKTSSRAMNMMESKF